MAGPITDFLSNFTAKPGVFGFPLPFLWKVTIDGASLRGPINQWCAKEGGGWQAKTTPDAFESQGGLLIATEVTLPSESTEFAEFGQADRGGFLPGYGSMQRTGFLSRGITVNLLETNTDLEHDFFRPWLVAVGTAGLVQHNLKTTMTITQYDNRGNKRKAYYFNDVFPTNIEGATLTQTDAGSFLQKTVTFACRNYKQA